MRLKTWSIAFDTAVPIGVSHLSWCTKIVILHLRRTLSDNLMFIGGNFVANSTGMVLRAGFYFLFFYVIFF